MAIESTMLTDSDTLRDRFQAAADGLAHSQSPLASEVRPISGAFAEYYRQARAVAERQIRGEHGDTITAAAQAARSSSSIAVSTALSG